jgi:putative sterol carrier protein
MAFANAEEFYKISEMLIQKIMKDEALFTKMKAMNMTTCQKITNLDAVTTIEWKEPFKYYMGPTPEGVKVDSTTINDDDTYNKFYQDKLNVMIAMVKGQIKSQGNMTAALKFLPMLKPVFKMYVEVLKEAGREDLIIK